MTAGPTLITVEEFFDPPTRSRAQISPDGRCVAYLAPWPQGVGQSRLNVFVRDLDGDWPDADDPAARRVTSDDRRSIETFLWAAGSRYLLFTQDTDGDENHHLHRVDPTRPEEPAVDLTPIRGRACSAPSSPRTGPGRSSCSSTRAAPTSPTCTSSTSTPAG